MEKTTMRTLLAIGSALALALALAACDTVGSSGHTMSGIDGGNQPDGIADPGAPTDADAVEEPGGDAGPAGDAQPTADIAPDDGTVVEPFRTCETDEDCLDGLDCTVDACTTLEGGDSVCTWTVVAQACLISHICRAPGEVKPQDACSVCDPAAPLAWTAIGEGGACDDGDACIEGETCQSGMCTGGTEVICDDGDDCTGDSCDPASGCEHPALPDGMACDDGDTCTEGDACVDGICTGAVADCDDGDPCTDDACDAETGCGWTFNEAPCEDGNPCTVGDTCFEGACQTGPDPNACDDDNICSINVCDPDVGCVHLPTNNPCCIGLASVCDDGDPCTDDICDPDTGGCSYTPNTADCDDGDQCTDDDVCAEGVCAGTAIVCDDGNDCTEDSCNISVGCVFTPVADGLACDDGLDCSTDDACVGGACAGDMSECKCTPEFDDSAKLTEVQITPNENEGNALDLDDDGDRDNAFGPFESMVNESLADSVADGSVMLLVEFRELQQGPFLLALYNGELAPENEACDHLTQTCDYLADASMVDEETCDPVVQLPATLEGDRVTAGGKDTVMPFSIPMQGVQLDITLFMVGFDALVTLGEGEQVTSIDGLLGGAVRYDDLEAAINALPPELLEELGPIVGALPLLKNLTDIDTDGDGKKDALSIALKVAGIDGRLTGVAE